jgi:hypothetical protein
LLGRRFRFVDASDLLDVSEGDGVWLRRRGRFLDG